MTARTALPTFVLGLAMAGCLSDEPKLTTVGGSSPFSKPGRTQTASFQHAKPATEQVAIRVKTIGQKIVAANPRIKQKVDFFTIGVPQEEIFHQTQKDVSTISITEGLAKQCKTDGELAAVLSEELGKLMSEQMVQTRPLRGRMPPDLIMNPHVGNDNNGTFGSTDGTDRMIAARFEKDWQQGRRGLPAPPPAPETLARSYLQSAGFNPKDLDTVKPLLKKAEKQSSLEQSMTGKGG
ncbi:MAG TPA: hypothetical protein VMG10_31065 [Gemmataceae bacterium]|nr:hypothetical protein [Gemmataceae bacterium]